MKKLFLKTLYLTISYVLCALILEMSVFLMMGIGGVFPTYFWFDLAAIVFIAGIIVLIPTAIAKTVLFSVFIGFQCVLNIANVCLYRTTGEVFYWAHFLQLSDGIQVFEISFIPFDYIAVVLAILAVFITALVFINKKIRIKSSFTFLKRAAIALAMMFALEACFSVSFFTQKSVMAAKSESVYEFEGDLNLYDSMYAKNMAFKKFGTFFFYLRDLIVLKRGMNVSAKKRGEAAKFLVSETSTANEYTGISQENSVITILLESLEYFAIDPYNTPFLYKLFYEDSVLLSEFYAHNRTNMSEGLVVCGNYSQLNPLIYGRATATATTANGTISFTMPQVLENNGYSSVYIHANGGKIYRRSTTFGNEGIGFDDIVLKNDMTTVEGYGTKEYQNWKNSALDVEVVNAYLNKFTADKTYVQFTTLSMHGPYYEKSKITPYYNELLSEENSENYNNMWNYLTANGYSKPSGKILTQFNWYKAATVVLNDALEALFEGLEAAGKLATTTVVLFADHHAYYGDLAYYLRGMNPKKTNAFANTELYHIPCAIYDQKLAAKLNDVAAYGDSGKTGCSLNTFCSTNNLTTTIFDLLGIAYYKNLYEGCSIFDSEITNAVFQSFLGSNAYFNNRIYFAGEVLYTAEGVTTEEIEKFKANVALLYKKQNAIEIMYQWPKEVFNVIRLI